MRQWKHVVFRLFSSHSFMSYTNAERTREKEWRDRSINAERKALHVDGEFLIGAIWIGNTVKIIVPNHKPQMIRFSTITQGHIFTFLHAYAVACRGRFLCEEKERKKTFFVRFACIPLSTIHAKWENQESLLMFFQRRVSCVSWWKTFGVTSRIFFRCRREV